jgi:hypothetical protein
MDMNLQDIFVNVIFANITTELALAWEIFQSWKNIPRLTTLGSCGLWVGNSLFWLLGQLFVQCQ